MKKFVSMALALCMSMALAVPAMAAPVDDMLGNNSPVEVTEADGTGSVPVELQTEGELTFSVTLPTSLPVYVDVSGNVYTAENLQIINQSAGAVDVKDVTVSGSGWDVQNYDDDFTQYAVDSKNFALMLQDTYKSTDTPDIDFTYAAGAGEFTNEAGEAFMRAGVGQAADAENDSINLSYDAKVSMQSTAFTEATIGSVVYTVGWYTGE